MPASRALLRALANLATITRLLLVGPIAVAIVHQRASVALALLTLAVATDGVDGWLARRFGTTALGSWLDATADRLLIAAVIAALWWSGGVPSWVALVLVMREVAVAAGAIALTPLARPVRPLTVGKVHTALAFGLLVVAVAAVGGLAPPGLVTALAFAVTVSAVVSLAVYARQLRRRAPPA